MNKEEGTISGYDEFCRDKWSEEIEKNKAEAKKIEDMLKGKFDMPEMAKGG